MLTLQEELFRRARVVQPIGGRVPREFRFPGTSGPCKSATRLDDSRRRAPGRGAQAFRKRRGDIRKTQPRPNSSRDGYYRDHHADTLMQVAIVLAIGKRHAEAEPLAGRSVDILEALVREIPKNKDYRMKLAYVQRLRAEQLVPTGRPAEAEACLRRSIELNPKDYWTHLQFGDLLHEARNFADAETCFRSAVAIDPRQFHSRYMLIDVLTRQNKLPQAIDALGPGRDGFDWFFLTLAHAAARASHRSPQVLRSGRRLDGETRARRPAARTVPRRGGKASGHG